MNKRVSCTLKGYYLQCKMFDMHFDQNPQRLQS